MTFLIIDDNILDVTSFLNHHPGGSHCLQANDMCDVTDLFHSIHNNVTYKPYIIKTIPDGFTNDKSDKSDKSHVHDFRELHKWMKENGWYKPSLSHFIKHIMVEIAIFSCSMYFTFNNMQNTGAILLGVFWHHSAGIGHDLGHSSVFQKRWKNCIVGSCMSIVTGLSSLWWRHSHFQHHIYTNIIPQDPDIMHLPIFAITEKIFSHKFHKFLNVTISANRLSVALITVQHITLYPLLLLARFNLYVQSIIHLLKGSNLSRNIHLYQIEQTGIILFFTWYTLILYTIATWKNKIIFLFLSHITSGVLHVQIVISHWVSETYSNQTDDHYLHTVKTTMDINCSKWIDWAHLGLQFQVAHHMYPRLPRYHLREATERVKYICTKHNLPYKSCTFSEANVLLYKNMMTIATKIKNGL